MTLIEKQQRFTVLIAMLILHAESLGYALTFGDAYRSPEEAMRLARLGVGIVTSLHTQRLAVDFNLFIDGRYRSDSRDFEPLGLWWESQSTPEATCCWGGRFGDGNHFSVGHDGRK